MRSQNPYSPISSRRYDVPQLATTGVPEAPKAGRPVRVFALVDRYPPMVNAGGEWMLHSLLADLAARGHDVDVVTAGVPEPFTLDGVNVWPRAETSALAAQCDVMVGHLMWTREAVENRRQVRAVRWSPGAQPRQLRTGRSSRKRAVLVVNSVVGRGYPHTRRRGVPEREAQGVHTWNGPWAGDPPDVRMQPDYQLEA